MLLNICLNKAFAAFVFAIGLCDIAKNAWRYNVSYRSVSIIIDIFITFFIFKDK